MFVDILKTIFLGIVEGITEWLPISSTGHLILADEFIQLGVTDAFKEMFDVVIQLGAILAVVVMFWHKLWPFQNDRSAQGLARWCREDVWQMWFHVLVAVLPSVVIGLPLDDWLTQHFHNPPVIALMLILYGVLFIWMENTIGKQRPRVRRIDQINYRIALFIGAFQVLSLIPGTSRSGATILGAMIIGCSRTIAAEFTFFLAVPTMFGASLLKIVKFLLESETGFSGQEIVILLVGMVTAFVVSLACIRFLMNFVKKHDYKVFGWYRIVLGVLVLGYFFGLKPLLAG
ncbi:undecaprenyl-diphosphate phosphatase [Ruthenibacterium sp. TH_2024_36131]|uniref:undecaprenyl-diphosphate phosphatase n=1 Tax=Owariibacterium komagatae TaxID=3136601 RepID=UPI0038B39FE1